MKKNFKYFMAAVAGMMAICTSCLKEDIMPENAGKNGYVTLDVSISGPDMKEVATKAVDPDGGGVQNITLFCFDQYGLFVSTISADVKPAGSGVSLTGTFKVQVPEHVKTVHLVGNQNLSYFAEGNYTGKSEVEVMSSLEASAGRMIYWARKAVSDLKPGTTVQLLRNQAKFSVAVADGVNFTENGWVVMNTSAFGTVAPYNSASGAFIAPTVENPFITQPKDETRLNSFYDVRIIDTEYYFETENTHDNPVDIIIRGTQGSGEELYYRVSLLDDEGEPLHIMRNHHYVINIAGELSYGQKDFNSALSASATNNIWVSVSDDVRKVFDNERSLEVDQTYVVVGENQIANPNTYNLTYSISRNGAALTEADKPEVYWQDGNNVAQYNFTHNFDASTGKGQMIITFLPMGDVQKREGTMVVKYGRLYRNIKVITVKEQAFTPAWITTNIYGGSANENVTMMFTIPETCPEELFPMDVLISVNDLDVRTESGMSLPTIIAGQEGYGQDNGIGYKYVLTVERTGIQRVYLETSLTHKVSEYVQVTVEAPHFQSLTKVATFQETTDTRILIHNLRKYVGATPADEYIYYYLVPQKIHAEVEFPTHIGQVVATAPSGTEGTTLTNPKGEKTHYRYVEPNMDFSETDGDGYNVDEFLLYSQNLEHNHHKPTGTEFYFDFYKDLNPVNWDATGGRVLGFIRNTNDASGTGEVFHLRTTTPRADEVVRIASNVKGAPSVTTGTRGELAVIKNYNPAECTGTGRHKSCVFELATFHPFHFAATINGKGTIAQGKDAEVVDQLDLPYEPGTAVDIKFDVTSFTSDMKDERGNLLDIEEQVSVDPFGTEFKVYIDAPMLEIDAARNTLPSDKFYEESAGRFVYVVDKDRAAESAGWTESALVEDLAEVDYLGNALSADKQKGERKSLPFKTKTIVSEGKITISSDENVVVFFSKTFNVANELITGTVRYGEPGSEKNVPAGSFVPFEVLPTYNRIGSMTIGADGRYELHLRGEYRYNWNTDDIKLQYVETTGGVEKIYEATFDSLAELYGQKDILLTQKK